MDGGFNFGAPAKRPAKLASSRGGSSAAVSPRLVAIAIGLVVAAAALFAFFRVIGGAGREIGETQSDAIAEIDRAHDVAAQTSASRALVAARTLSAESGSFPDDAATLSAFDPSMRFTTGGSTGPGLVSFTSTGSTFAAAVRSESGTCWWVTLDRTGVTRYGSGGSCTGRAATAATGSAW